MMFVGNSPQHAGNVGRAFDADTCRVIATRDAKFLDKMFYRSDYTPSALVPHVNDIVLNRLHIPNNLPIRDEGGDPVESDTDNSLGTTDDREDDQWQIAVNNELLSLRRNQYGRPESGIAFSGWVLRYPTDAPRGARLRAGHRILMDEAGNGEDTLTIPPNIDSMRAFRDNNTPTDEECSSDESSVELMPSLEARESTDEDENEEGRRGDPEEPFFMEREDDEDDDEAPPHPGG